MQKSVFLNELPGSSILNVYPDDLRQRIASLTSLHDGMIGRDNFRDASEAAVLKDAQIAFSTWGMPRFSVEEIEEAMPNLEAVLYGAGSVQVFARPFLERGIRVCSAWMANGFPVAQYTLAQILLANKGYWQSMPFCKQNRKEAQEVFRRYPGNYRIRIGLLGIGAIGSMVAEFLKPFNFEVLAFDPFLTDEKAKVLKVRKTDLDEIFSTCQTISNHLANLPATVGILNERHFNAMLPTATFINTGRGAQVVEADLAAALAVEPGRVALLDVSSPEPMQWDNPLIKLPNVFLTPHIAGSSGNEVVRMGEYMIEECERLLSGEPLQYEVTLEMLETMA